MGVKIADKLTQFNNGTYYLVDSSAVEYVDKDGNTKSVKDVLDNGIGEGNTTDLTDIENRVTTNETNITDLQEQTSDLQEQIDNLDIPDLTDLENASRVYCDIAEINNAKGTNISLVVGEDNTEKIMNVLAPNEVFANWFNNESAYNRFGINSNIGTRINIISIQKYHDNNGAVIAITNKGKVLSRYMRNNILSNWDYDATDLTEINDKLTQLENKQINKKTITNMSPTESCYKITPTDDINFSKILISDLYGGCILITGSVIPDYKSFKVVRLSNGNWSDYSPSNNTGNKILSIHYDGSFIYVKFGNYLKFYIEGGYTNIEKIDSLPTGTTQLPIFDLTQQTDLTDINDKLSKLEDKRVYNSVEELNTAKGLSISFTNGEDNTMKIVDALSPIETFADYFSNGINNNRFGIDTNTYGTDILLLTVTKFNDNMTIIRAFMVNGKILVRRYVNGVLEDWKYDKTDLSEVNTKLTQLENTINEVGGGGIYQSGEIEVGTWTGGQKLYRYTISDTTERTFSSGVMMLDFFTLSRDEHVVVKLDGTFRMCATNDNSGAHTVYALPYVDLDTNRQVHLVYTTQDRVRLSGKNLKDYKILGYDVSIYYYKK